jgi:hypothetical protein
MRGQGGVERGGTPSSARQDGSSGSTSYQTGCITKKHMDNDALIIGLNFEP